MIKYTHEQDEWLKSYYSGHTVVETTTSFNARFGMCVSWKAIKTHCQRKLGLTTNTKNYFSEGEINWLRENFGNDESREETYQRFISCFGDSHSYDSVISTCKKLGLKKPSYRRCYQVGNRTWSTGLSSDEHRSHFSEGSFVRMTSTACINFPHLRDSIMYGTNRDVVVSDLGDGRRILIPYRIYKRMTWRGVVGQGEITRAQLAIELVKEKLNGIKETNR